MTLNDDLAARVTALEGAVAMLVCTQAMQDCNDILDEAKRLFKAACKICDATDEADEHLAMAHERLWARIEALLTRPLPK